MDIKVLTAAEVAEIRAKAEKATPGPWDAPGLFMARDLGAMGVSDSQDCPCSICEVDRHKDGPFAENAGFIARSRTDVPALCDTVDALRAELTRREHRQSDGNDWAVATFGAATIESTMRRIDQEMREFYEDPVGEAKDIAIFLYRLMSVAGKDLDAEVDAKMEINRRREWVLNGEGCGQHVGSTAKKGVMEELLELRAENTRLKGLIEGMGHEAGCASIDAVHFVAEGWSPATGKPCNCIQSKVTA